jgi:hypothetical protein
MHIQKIYHDSAGEIFENGEFEQKPRLEDPIRLRVRVMRYGAPFIEFDTAFSQEIRAHPRSSVSPNMFAVFLKMCTE